MKENERAVTSNCNTESHIGSWFEGKVWRLTVTSVDKDVEKLEFSCPAGETEMVQQLCKNCSSSTS